MKKLISFLLLIWTSVLYAGDTQYLVPVTRDGVTHTMVAYNFWSGEYPGPVINVKAGKNGKATIKGYASLRKLDDRQACTIKSGLYHPWSKDKNSLVNLYSLVEQVNHKALVDGMLEGNPVKAGDVVKYEIPQAEGYCGYLLSKKEVSLHCGDGFLDDPTKYKRTVHPSHEPQQWLYLKCDEGHKVFVQDTDLLAQLNVERGKIVEYGKVSP